MSDHTKLTSLAITLLRDMICNPATPSLFKEPLMVEMSRREQYDEEFIVFASEYLKGLDHDS